MSVLPLYQEPSSTASLVLSSAPINTRVGPVIDRASLILSCRFTGGDFKKYVGSPGSKSKLWDTAVNPLKIKKQDFASGVAAGVLLNSWSVGYSSSGEVPCDFARCVVAVDGCCERKLPG